MASMPQFVSLWTYRKIPYEFQAGFPFENDVTEAMDKWKEHAGVWFVERSNELNYLVIQQGAISNSFIGMIGGAQTVNISDGYKALHELGHALGLIHEQCRVDRDTFVDIQWNNIAGGHNNPDFIISPFSQNLTPYDRISVMHYPAPAKGWGGFPPDKEVWTMRWRADQSVELGGEVGQGWANLSELDKVGLLIAYQDVPVPMGTETEHGVFKFGYEVQFPFTIGGRVFFYGQNMNEKNWFIQELLIPGILGPETDHGTWDAAYKVQFTYTIGNRIFFYGQEMKDGYWFIRELLPGGKMGDKTDSGSWSLAYESQVPFTVDAGVFFFVQNMEERTWFIQQLMPDGKMGYKKDHGTWKFGYEVLFTYTVANSVYLYGQNMNEKNWFIQELLPDGKLGPETANGTWNNAYKVQFPYNIDGNQYFYAQNLDSKYWFIQRLNQDGTMGEELQNGFWSYPYAAQFPFQVGGAQYFYGQNIKGKNWFIQSLINV